MSSSWEELRIFRYVSNASSLELQTLTSSCDQVQLDDSRVSVATIASSRYVGPIKEKVEDWQRQLKLMNDTLVCEAIY